MITSRLLAAAVLAAATAGIAPAAFAQPSPAPAASAPARHHHGNAYMRALRSVDLTDAQRTQIRTLMTNARTNMQSTSDPAARKANFQHLREQIEAVLTPAQRTKLQQTLAAQRQSSPSRT
jgi:Spy/CpxP family protein refolding chaperone